MLPVRHWRVTQRFGVTVPVGMQITPTVTFGGGDAAPSTSQMRIRRIFTACGYG
jgi:hypothetical protein